MIDSISNTLNEGTMKQLFRNLRAAFVFHRALRAQQDGRFKEALALLQDFESDAYFMAKAELLRGMAHHRLGHYVEAVRRYDRFLSSLVEDMPEKDRAYVREYAMFYRSRAQAILDPSTPLHSSLEELRRLQSAAPRLTRKEFDT